MKRKLYCLLLSGLFGFTTGPAVAQQVDYAAFLNAVAERSPQLKAAQKSHTATVRSLRTGLAPEDPSVGLEYYFSNETRYELAVEQSFDFPTVYHQRNKISKLGISKAEQEYQATKRGLLMRVSDAYLTLNYAVERLSILNQRRENLQRVVAMYREGVAAGQYTAMELRNAQMLLTEIENSITLAEAERDEAAATLTQLNGGDTVEVQGYPLFRFTGSADEFVSAALAADYALQSVALDTLIAQRELKLSRNEWIPKLKVGYKLEMEGTRGTNALLAGISVPLWQNSGRTRYARAQQAAAQAQHEAMRSETETRLKALYERYQSLLEALEARRGDEEVGNYPALLREAVAAGRISDIEALMGLSEWYDMRDSLMALEYAVAIAGASMAICLM